MQPSSPPPQDTWTLIITAMVVIITSFISVARRVARSQRIHWITVLSEYAACVLVGYLAYETYPAIKPLLPSWLSWITVNVWTATGSYIGIRAFHVVEDYFYKFTKERI